MSTVVEIVESRALVGNPLGHPGGAAGRGLAAAIVRVGRPTAATVIYWLAGYTGTGEMMFSGHAVAAGPGRPARPAGGAGAMGEAIVVAPDGFTRWGGAQYLDSPAIGDYETHVVREVIPAIDARFRTIATRDARAIGGKSSGGFGALVLAMRHPDLFSAVASHAGDMYFELSALPDLPVGRAHAAPPRRRRRFPAALRGEGARSAPPTSRRSWCWRRRRALLARPGRAARHRAALRPRHRRDRLGGLAALEGLGPGRDGRRRRTPRRCAG